MPRVCEHKRDSIDQRLDSVINLLRKLTWKKEKTGDGIKLITNAQQLQHLLHWLYSVSCCYLLISRT